MRCLHRFIAVTACLLTTAMASAHHGKDFLFTETLHFMPGNNYFLANANFFRVAGENVFELEPALLAFFNPSHPIAAEVHFHFAKVGSEALAHEATGFALRTALVSSPDWSLGVSAEREFSAGVEQSGNEFRLIGQKQCDTGLLAANLIFGVADDETTSWGYATGFHVQPLSGPSYAVELVGNFTEKTHMLVPSLQFALGSASTVLKVGVGVGLTNDSPDWSAHLGFVQKL